MFNTYSITDLISQRYSVRKYRETPIPENTQTELQTRLDTIQSGPFGTHLRLRLVAATESDNQSLRGLSAYGSVKNPAGYIVGAVKVGEHALEDYGYAMEQAVLAATSLGLGTCWVGGVFSKSGFAQKIGKGKDEVVPAITPTGYAEEDAHFGDPAWKRTRTNGRLPGEALFFEGKFGQPLEQGSINGYAEALEMVRQAPSASNKQPWRILRAGKEWHFYCLRTPGYGKDTLLFKLLGIADLQRLDIGIAMCHFELTARQLELNGEWVSSDPGLPLIDKNTVYIATWKEKD
jgi:nitroreductase